MSKLESAIRRFVLRFQESQLVSDLVLASERRQEARESIDKLLSWEAKARERLRVVRARLAAIEDPQKLLDEVVAAARKVR